MKSIALALLIGVSALGSVSSQHIQYKNNNFYAFEKAENKLDKPPRVRKPPYISADVDCPGVTDGPARHSPKNTLCGDINSGFIPRNPLGQNLFGQPYPFELIKNKTLLFLANSLPILKQRMQTIPKVAKIAKSHDFIEPQQAFRRRFVRQISNSSSLTDNAIKSGKNGSDLLRQNLCEGNSICQAIDALRTDGPFSKSFLTNLVSAVSNAAALGNMASMVNELSTTTTNNNHNHNNDEKKGNKSTISQVLSTLSTISEAQNYNPLVSIIDYISTFQNSNKFPSRRRKPLEAEDLLPEQIPEQTGTPCQSVEEYISPTYARNYQGIWKYVVQIPSEGYFTQTIQRTSCLKNKCDFMDGMCLESPRWVSLLVAEVFYPDVYFPVGGEQPLNYKPNNMVYGTNNQIISIKNNHKLKPKTPSLPANYPVFPDDLKRMDSPDSHRFRDAITPRTGRRVAGKPQIQELDMSDDLVGKVSKAAGQAQPPTPAQSGATKDCDGYDKIGCYVIRVYYDWFLVNGSCKCWKSGKPSNSINEAIKRIFIGKW